MVGPYWTCYEEGVGYRASNSPVIICLSVLPLTLTLIYPARLVHAETRLATVRAAELVLRPPHDSSKTFRWEIRNNPWSVKRFSGPHASTRTESSRTLPTPGTLTLLLLEMARIAWPH